MKKGGGSASTIIIGPSNRRSGLCAPQLRKRLRACPISGVGAKIIIIIVGRVVYRTQGERVGYRIQDKVSAYGQLGGRQNDSCSLRYSN